MNADTFFLIKVIFGIIAAIFTLSAAIFTFLDTAQNDKTEKTQAWFEKKWKRLEESGWLKLPERATNWLLRTRNRLAIRVDQVILDSGLTTVIFLLGGLMLFFVLLLKYFGFYVAILGIAPSLLIIVIPILMFSDIIDTSGVEASVAGCIVLIGLITAVPVTGILTVVLSLYLLLEQNLFLAILWSIGLIPFIGAAILMPTTLVFLFVKAGKSSDRPITIISHEGEQAHWLFDFPLLFSIGAAVGFTLTFFAMALGNTFEPSAHLPRTLQMLFSNVVFDGLTTLVTYVILSWTVTKSGLVRFLLGILSVFILAGIFAMASLYFGLVLTVNELSVKTVFWILLGRSFDNSHFEFSPYFWIMHTTFIPTLLYLLLILFCCAGKALLIPVRWFFGMGQENKNPLKLTAGLCGIFAAIFTILFFVTGSIQERAKEVQARPVQPAVIENNTN